MSRLRILLAVALLLPGAAGWAQDRDGPPVATAQRRTAAAEALKEVDDLLKKTSEITGMPILHPVKSAVAGKDEIERYIRGRLKETITPEKVRAQELALKKFGLLPADFELETFLIQLLTEQAAAYYDPQRKEIFIADWTPLALQRPAIVHELTHALQDQQTPLDDFLQDDRISQDEQVARQAVVEGGAVLAMMQYMFAMAGMQADVSRMGELVASATNAELKKFPVFSAAPLYLREGLLFPYTAGMQYMSRLVDKQGKKGYVDALKNPPRSTAEVLHPGRPAPSDSGDVKAPDVQPMPAGFKLLDSDVLGEFDVRVLLKQYAGEETALKVAPAWRGFRYALYENEGRTATFLAHRSRWQDAAAAAAFAAAYHKVLAAKRDSSARVTVAADTVSVIEGLPR